MKNFRMAVALVLATGLALQMGDVKAASLKSSIEVKVKADLTNVLDLNQATAPLVALKQLELANGTGAFQANTVWSDRRSLGSSVTEDLDLAGGGLVDAFGVAFAPAKVRAILIYASPSNTVDLTLFGDANSVPILNTAATTYTLQPGGVFLAEFPATAGKAVTAGTGDIIQVANGAGSSSYDIIVIGTSS
jgi:hypothetical protein